MRQEIITMRNVKVIGIAKEIAFNKGPEECPKFWNAFFREYVKPVIDGAIPNPFQKAVIDNHIGRYAVCDCDLTNRNCCECGEDTLAECAGKIRYIIAGRYERGEVPEGMTLMDLPNGQWIKFHFDGGMTSFQQQYQAVFKQWMPTHKNEFGKLDMLVEWYDGDDITSPDFQCGIMLHISKTE